ncbi:hypothetical protein D3C85_1229900 [compost metagenome]
MGLLQMNTGRARLFPHIANSIQTHIIGTFLQIMQQDVHHADQHFRISKIQVYLVGTEGCPNMFYFTILAGKWCQQRGGSWSHDVGKVSGRIHGNKIVIQLGFFIQETVEPGTLRRHVITHIIKHQVGRFFQCLDMRPITTIGRYTMKVDDRKTIVRRPWVEWQYVDRIKTIL